MASFKRLRHGLWLHCRICSVAAGMGQQGRVEGPAAVQVTSFEQRAEPSRANEEEWERWNGDRNEYVLHLTKSSDCSTVASSLSNHTIVTHCREILKPKLKIPKSHTLPITDLCFSPSTPHFLASSSEDKTVKGWDTRAAGGAVVQMCVEDEAQCCSLGLGGDLIAAGVGKRVHLYDVRNASRPLGTYSDVHTDDITKVMFHPSEALKLASGAEDGLVCFYDLGVGQRDEALLTIVNAECAVRQLAFFGPQHDGLAVLTGTETLSLYHWPTARRVADFGDLRVATQAWAHPAQFGIGCHYHREAEELLVSTGDDRGHVTLSRVTPGALTPLRELKGGHSALVRAVDYSPSSIVTGGEDARLCLWNGAPVAPQLPQGGAGMGGAGKDKFKAKPFKPY